MSGRCGSMISRSVSLRHTTDITCSNPSEDNISSMTRKLLCRTGYLTHEAQTAQKGTMNPHDKDRAGTSPFRFKRKHHESDGDYGEAQNDSRKRHRHHHRHHHDS